MSDIKSVTCPDCLGSGKDPHGERPWTKYDGDACLVCAGHGRVSPELAELVIGARARREFAERSRAIREDLDSGGDR